GFEETKAAFCQELTPCVAVESDDVERLVREGFNSITARPGRAAIALGSVTLARTSAGDRKFQSLGVRRLCLAITNAVERATRWAVFEANETQVADRIHAQVHACLSSLADAGAFADDRFVVQCDAGLHVNASNSERGVTILLAFRPSGARERISLTLHQTVSGCRVATTAFAPANAECS
ncbi:MAG: hypothetical protein WD448_02270, partial [Woeseia sp.]